MRTDVPEIRRCCCCVPLRYGLLVSCYLKLVFGALFLTMFIAILTHRGNRLEVVPLISTIVLLLDAIFNMIFLFGGHTKNAKIIRIYYIYSVCFTALVFLLLCLVFGWSCYIYGGIAIRYGFFLIEILGMVSLIFAFLLVQIYYTLMVRTEMIKLRYGQQFRFENRIADGQCTVTMEVPYGGTTEIPNVTMEAPAAEKRGDTPNQNGIAVIDDSKTNNAYEKVLVY